MYQNILVAYNGSPESQAALRECAGPKAIMRGGPALREAALVQAGRIAAARPA
ncbi:MAG: hypothetical protein ACK5D0_01050 [Burkholderiaceae bacterium]